VLRWFRLLSRPSVYSRYEAMSGLSPRADIGGSSEWRRSRADSGGAWPRQECRAG